ncbi:hypothetical protein AVEN_87535-1 [Araneus ventricosus]|uniref:Uncharacterized protein n=1 Tax=Araneus ventricosus TaxID=182803 RepID=A0A4Y2VA26_ARAVE|nr:hypothetical protein AVEN_87535-1 [Araneus ventricosus]
MDMRRRDLFYGIRRCVMAQPSRENAFSCRFDRSCCSASRKPNRLNGEWGEMPARGERKPPSQHSVNDPQPQVLRITLSADDRTLEYVVARDPPLSDNSDASKRPASCAAFICQVRRYRFRFRVRIVILIIINR